MTSSVTRGGEKASSALPMPVACSGRRSPGPDGALTDTVELGGLAARAGVRVLVLVLTHLIPAPATPAEESAFIDDVREGGFDGEVVVGRDLATVWLAGGDTRPEITPGIAPEVAFDLREPRQPAAR